ncbi:hypothetical protein ARMGADRAFT_1032747 [Armillaria gallica]|uniref:Uncharacterized protein n=1 Tax=Armillaria gallica TaxID=47427 RepID=A0A2H3D4K3_ARMGA|nr:hypothetical protein ARMGADRAFT_1032747 [Armillaria gallica]
MKLASPLSLPYNATKITLPRSQSFPAPRFVRVGLVYSARVIHDTTHSNLPELCVKVAKPEYGRTLAREAWFYEQLAVESGCEGVIIPRCFGFFTIPLKDCFDIKGQPVSHVEPWKNVTLHPPEPPESDESDVEENTDGPDNSEGTDWLPDDRPYPDKYFKDDDG